MRSLVLGLAGALVVATTAAAQQPAQIPVQSYTLPNGLRVVLAEDHSAQTVAVNLWYDVGSRDERRGRTGFAHLFEHMMFMGSENVPSGQHLTMIEEAGGMLNASTAEDRTNYFEVVPSNRLNLALWMEADRMRSLQVTEQNLDIQRKAVQEERRLRVDNAPYTKLFFEYMYGIADSTTCFPYAHSVIGSMADLNAASLADVQAFFKEYYVPNNATLVVTGDFQPAEARRLVEQYFAGIPRGAEPPDVAACAQAFNTGEVRRAVSDVNATLPAVLQTYRAPAATDADTPALELLATILGSGQSSRLNQALVRDAKAAAAAQALFGLGAPRRGVTPFGLFAVANAGATPDSLDRLLSAEVARVREQGVSAEELAKAVSGKRAELINERQTAFTRAEAIQRNAFYFGDPAAVNTELERYTKVTPADIQRVAQKYLIPANRIVFLVTTGATS